MKNNDYYSVLWQCEIDEKGDPIGDFEEQEFKTKAKALNFYNKHKKDKDKHAFLVTKRNEEGFIIEDIIY